MFCNPFPNFRRIFAKSIVRRFFAFSLLVAVCIYGADKELGGGVNRAMARGLRTVINAGAWCFSVVEQAVGYALTEVEEGEEYDLTMPESADVAEAIAARGAFEDSVMVGAEAIVRTDGTIENDSVVYNVRPGKYGFLPGFWWDAYGTLRIWSMTNGESAVVTWEGALEERLTNSVVSFQAELYGNGDVAYRYSPMVGTNGVRIVRADNELILCVATNTTSLYFAYIADLGDGTGDYDCDGLTDYEEVMVYRTNPRLLDTDEDGVNDGVEITIDINPISSDSDGEYNMRMCHCANVKIC